MSRVQRRDVLRGVLGAGLAFGPGSWLLGSRTARAGGYTKVLMLGDVFVGYLHDAQGGGAVGGVVLEKLGADNIQHKHIGPVSYEDLVFTCGSGMSKVFWEWIETSLAPDNALSRRDGAVLTCDENLKVVSGRSFTGALITAIGFPALDAASKDAAKLTVTLQPETVAASPVRKPPKPIEILKRDWLVGNFRLKIGGLDEACARVSKIDAMVLRRAPPASGPGAEMRDAAPSLTPVEAPNLVLTVPERDAKPFYAWHEDFVIKGNNGQNSEKGGTLEYLDPSGPTMFTLKLAQLGIFKISPDKVEAGSENIRRVTAAMYCERIEVAVSR